MSINTWLYEGKWGPTLWWRHPEAQIRWWDARENTCRVNHSETCMFCLFVYCLFEWHSLICKHPTLLGFYVTLNKSGKLENIPLIWTFSVLYMSEHSVWYMPEHYLYDTCLNIQYDTCLNILCMIHVWTFSVWYMSEHSLYDTCLNIQYDTYLNILCIRHVWTFSMILVWTFSV